MILLPNESHCSRLLRIRLAFPQISKPHWLAVSICCPISTDLNCKRSQISDRILNFFPSNLSRFHSVQILIYVTQTCICDTKLNLIWTFTAFHSDTQQFNLFLKRHGWYVYSVLACAIHERYLDCFCVECQILVTRFALESLRKAMSAWSQCHLLYSEMT